METQVKCQEIATCRRFEFVSAIQYMTKTFISIDCTMQKFFCITVVFQRKSYFPFNTNNRKLKITSSQIVKWHQNYAPVIHSINFIVYFHKKLHQRLHLMTNFVWISWIFCYIYVVMKKKQQQQQQKNNTPHKNKKGKIGRGCGYYAYQKKWEANIYT